MDTELSKRFFTKQNIFDEISIRNKELTCLSDTVRQFNYLYIIHIIINHNTRNREDMPGCPICIEYLGKLFSKSNQETADIVRNLVNWNIIFQSEPSVFKKKCAKYQITPQYLNEDSYIILNVIQSEAPFISKLIYEEQEEIVFDKLIHKFLNVSKLSLSVNLDGYDYLIHKYNLFISNDSVIPKHGSPELESAFLLSKSELLYIKKQKKINGGYGIEQRDIPLFLILIGEFRCTRPVDKDGKKSRVYNNITNLPREHRKYISLDGKPILMTDISNSQILLTVPMIEKYYKIHSGKGALDMPADIIKFRNWAESGQFYEKFSKLLTQIEMTYQQRKEMKIYIFRELWFGAIRRNRGLRIKPVFKEHFPTVLKIIKAYKIKNYRLFSRALQRFEAEIMIDKVAKKLLVKHKVLTLHDAIICNDEAVLIKAEALIKEVLAKHGLTPKFKREEEGKVNNNKAVSSPPPELSEENIAKECSTKWGKDVKPLTKRNHQTPAVTNCSGLN